MDLFRPEAKKPPKGPIMLAKVAKIRAWLCSTVIPIENSPKFKLTLFRR